MKPNGAGGGGGGGGDVVREDGNGYQSREEIFFFALFPHLNTHYPAAEAAKPASQPALSSPVKNENVRKQRN